MQTESQEPVYFTKKSLFKNKNVYPIKNMNSLYNNISEQYTTDYHGSKMYIKYRNVNIYMNLLVTNICIYYKILVGAKKQTFLKPS